MAAGTRHRACGKEPGSPGLTGGSTGSKNGEGLGEGAQVTHHNLQTERVQLEGDNKELAVSETVEPEVGLRAEGG